MWTEYLMEEFSNQYNELDNSRLFRQINPLVYGQPLYKYNEAYVSWSVEWTVDHSLGAFEQALQQVFRQREEIINQDIVFPNFQELGRILSFETQITTYDGAAAFQSNGFIDESDAPPIDTWFYLEESIKQQVKKPYSLFFWKTKREVEKIPSLCLFCWIPKQFESVMQAAIDVEIFDSYHWLDEASPVVYQQIVAAMSA